VPGRREGADLHFAALATGLAAHLDDFDDTHLESGNIHASSIALAATLGIGIELGVSGDRFISAFALACEMLIRAGLALAPAHHQEGWQPSATVGAMAGAVGAGLLLGLDRSRMADAIRIASIQLLGHREAFGTPTKAFHPGKAAANGILAARLVQAGMEGPHGVLESEGGFCSALARINHPELMVEGLGHSWELLRNTYKPYPCGVVRHPGIDAARAVFERCPEPASILEVSYLCHPLVMELTDRPDPQDASSRPERGSARRH